MHSNNDNTTSQQTGSFAHASGDAAYDEAINFLYSQLPMFSRVGGAAYKPGLETSEKLDAHFGHPHRRFKSVHIGGTNGKGSTSHTLAAILQAQGYKVGLYTSPHLVDFRERIRVDGQMIPRQAVVDFVRRWRGCGYEGHPSFFELTMMMAFDWFARAEVDYAVIEVGMGGRLDSTNIITPVASVITNISPDHMQFLGATLPEIAAEKAGIIKPGIPAVVGEAEGEVRRVFERKGVEVETVVRFAEDEGLLTSAVHSPAGGLDCQSPTLGDFHYGLSGDYQAANARTVLSAVAMLRRCGVDISDDALRRGMDRVTDLTGLRGRWEVLGDCPLRICDTGHNEAGLRCNMAQLRRLASQRSDCTLRLVIGFVADKDVDHILQLLPAEAEYYVTQAAIPRALSASDLMAAMQARGLHCRLCPTPGDAYRAACSDAAPQDVVYVGGSTFVVADLLASLDTGNTENNEN